jgi:hypothetical protein
MTKRIKVYIASPYTHGDKGKNVRVQIDAANILMRHGMSPFVPLLGHYQDLDISFDEWLDHDLQWLKLCDCVLYLNPYGLPSLGADMELEVAKDLDLPIFTTLGELILYSW